MVLLHGGNKRGTEFIASAWARARGIKQIVFRPDFARFGKAAPFKRNDELLAAQPAGLIVFPGNGISENLADKASQKQIKLWRIQDDAAHTQPSAATAA